MSKHHLILPVVALLALACSSDTTTPTPPPPPPPDVTVTKVDVAASTSTMNAVGATVTLTATARDQNGDVVSGVTPTWTSSNPAVVNVDASGKATAVANGTAVVSAKVGQVSGQVTLNVQQVVVAVAVEPETWSPTALGSTQQFEAIARDALGQPVAGWTTEWVAADDSLITLTTAGLATARSVGSTSLRAVIGTDTAIATISITQQLVTLEASPSDWNPTSLGVTQQVTVVGKDANDNPVSDWTAAWTTSDSAIVAVHPDGVLEARSQGSATVSIAAGSITSHVAVSIAQQLVSFSIAPGADTIATLGDSLLLVATAADSNGRAMESATITWSSSSSTIASVSATGVVTAVAPGTAVITATALGENAAASVTVLDAPLPVATSIAVSPEDWTATAIGERQEFTAVVRDVDGKPVSAGTVVWQSANPAVASVDASGEVTALGNGTTTITGKAGGLSSAASIVVDQSGAIANGVVWTFPFARMLESPVYIANGQMFTPAFEFHLDQIPFTPPWEGNQLHKFQWEAERIGVLSHVSNGQGTLWVRDRLSEWAAVAAATVSDFQLEGNRIAALHGNGTLQVKTGIHGGWVAVGSGNVAQFQLEGSRTALLEEDGDFFAMDGGATLSKLADKTAAKFQLEGNRIGLLHKDGTFRVKEGIHGGWTILDSGNAADFWMEGNRIVVLSKTGSLRGKDGIHGTWVSLASGAFSKVQLDGNRIGVMRPNGSFYVQDGLVANWVTLATAGATDFSLHKSRIALVTGGTTLRVKKGGPSAPWAPAENATGPITQVHAAVAVPTPDYRETRANYLSLRAACQAECVRNAYIPFRLLPVPAYGRNCGDEYPIGLRNVIDGVDALCFHHDHAPGWYASSTGSVTNDLKGACIVRFGLIHARMTRDGRLLTPGTPEYNAARGLFPGTADAFNRYMSWTSSCTSGYMSQFTADTRLGL